MNKKISNVPVVKDTMAIAVRIELSLCAILRIGGKVMTELVGQNAILHFHTSMVCTETRLHGQVMTGYISWKKPNVAVTEIPVLNACKLIGLPALTETKIGICVQQDTSSQAFTVRTVTTFTILSMRGVANLVEHPVPTNLVTMRTCGQDLTGTEKEWSHVPELVITSLGSIDPRATTCTVLRNSNAVNCRQLMWITFAILEFF